MKKNIKALTLAAIASLTMMAWSCSDDDVVDNGGTNEVVTDQSNVEIIATDSIDMYEYWTNVLKEAQAGNGEEDSLSVVEATEELAAMDSIWDAYVAAQGGNASYDKGEEKPGKFNVIVYTVQYESVDENGNPITLSELVATPYKVYRNNFNFYIPDANDFVLYCHGTLYNNIDRPSNFCQRLNDGQSLKELQGVIKQTQSGKQTRKSTYLPGISVMPDFEGFGSSSSKNYPCMNLDVLARQAIDGLEAARTIVIDKKIYPIIENWTTSVWGYGEGASIAATTQMYLENNKGSDGKTLAEKYRLRGSSLVNGIYNPKELFLSLAVRDTRFETEERQYIYDPVQFAYMIKAMCEYDPNLKGKYTPKDFLTDKFLNTGVLDFLNNKNKRLVSYADSLFAKSWTGDFNVYLPTYYSNWYGGSWYGIAKYNKEWYDSEKKATSKFDYYFSHSYGGGSDGSVDSYGYGAKYNNPGATTNDIFVFNEEFHDIYINFSDIVRDYDELNQYYYHGKESAKFAALAKAFDNQSLCSRSWTPKYPVYVSYSLYPRAVHPAELNAEEFKQAMSSSSQVYYHSYNLIVSKYNLSSYSKICELRQGE